MSNQVAFVHQSSGGITWHPEDRLRTSLDRRSGPKEVSKQTLTLSAIAGVPIIERFFVTPNPIPRKSKIAHPSTPSFAHSTCAYWMGLCRFRTDKFPPKRWARRRSLERFLDRNLRYFNELVIGDVPHDERDNLLRNRVDRRASSCVGNSSSSKYSPP